MRSPGTSLSLSTSIVISGATCLLVAGVASIATIGCSSRAPSPRVRNVFVSVVHDGGPPTLPPPEPDPTMDEWLADDAPKRFLSRCRVGVDGPIRLLPRGPLQGRSHSPHGPPHEALVVVEERGEEVRVILSNSHLRIVAFVPRETLVEVPIEATFLSPGIPFVAEPNTGVRLAPGTEVEEVARTTTFDVPMRRIRGKISVAAFEGWLTEGAFGRVWTDAPFVPRDEGNGDGAIPARHDALVRQAAPIFVVGENGHRAIAARIEPSGRGGVPTFAWGVQALGQRGAYQRIRFVRPEIEIIGEVAAADFRMKRPNEGEWSSSAGIGFEGGGGMTDSDRAIIREGAPLYAPGTEIPIGIALKGARAYFAFHAKKAPRVAAQIPFGPVGFLSVTVRSEDLGTPE